MSVSKYQPVTDYIDKKWEDFTFHASPRWGGFHNLIMMVGWIKLPNQAIAPNDQYFTGTQWYWDSYFTILGLVVCGRIDQAKQMVENLCFLFDRFKLFPARNNWTSIGRTQPPFLTRMAWEVYEAGGADQVWLEKILGYAKKEYEDVWSQPPRWNEALKINRYWPKYFPERLIGYESGWDISTRFAYEASNVIPVDLNCLLYQYEADFAALAKLQNNSEEEKVWKQRIKERRDSINRLFWDEDTGFYYDYDQAKQESIPFKTLAGFYPLWAGVASEKQAKHCIKQLKVFEHSGGLVSSEKCSSKQRQWDYPNGWPPLQYVTTRGLRRYGFAEKADRITRSWLDLNLELFTKTGKLWEKYDVVNQDIGKDGKYPTQPGFAWTNAVFIRLLHEIT